MNRRFAALQVAVSAVALAAVVWWASRQDAPQIPHSSGALAWLVGALGVYALATLLRAERWRRIIAVAGLRAPARDVYALTVVGYMGNNVLPARAGEMLRVVLLSRRSQAGKRQLLGTVVSERVLDAAALGLILVVVAYGLLHGAGLPSERPLLVAAGGALVLALAVALLQLLRSHPALARLRQLVRPLAQAPRALLGRRGILPLAGSIVIWSLEASVYFAVARAVGIEINPIDALYIVAITNLFAMLPAAPGYVGTFDAAVLFGIKAVGAASSLALSYLVLLRFVLFVPITLVGLGVLIARYGGWAAMRSALRVEASKA
ncbi:lysylphosphatidylglycerol synthase transmembrane domain-containing protein [Thermoleophilum album]|uniref:Lysylphosphatidylglycerol synthase TM region n=1 Tax=Thermoleophilum album TaxID=29539 RepID=A0A1H6FYX1_THEAL|nr:lysylphosphatidylglycerol synthase transmembrane domain-containing protein [Thermoleophilum album]SEH15213.1 hypothetical protein SAMN02745716_1877 [Thermoleophilum album]